MEIVDFLSLTGVFLSFLGVFISGYAARKKIVAARQKMKIDNLESQETTEEKLFADKFSKTMLDFASFSKKFKPDFVIGLNQGGTMIGAGIALGLGVPNRNFGRCYVNTREDYAECDIKNLYGKILLVDDICRTGNTMRLAKKYLSNEFKDTLEVNLATLVSVVDPTENPSSLLTFYAYSTSNKDFRLPWTDLSGIDGFEDIQKSRFKKVCEQPLEDLEKELRDRFYEVSHKQKHNESLNPTA